MEKRHFDGCWTNEKHLSFLNWMEASFVRRMLEKNHHCFLTSAIDGHLHLDRCVPESADSSLDFNHTNKTQENIEIVEEKSNGMLRLEKRKRNESSTQDQVVPQLGNMK